MCTSPGSLSLRAKVLCDLWEKTIEKEECWGHVSRCRSAAGWRKTVGSALVAVQSLSCVWLFVTPWTAACQASLSVIVSQSLIKLMSIESVMPSNHLILCHRLFLLPSIFPSIRSFFSEPWAPSWLISYPISEQEKFKARHTSGPRGTSRKWLSKFIPNIVTHYNTIEQRVPKGRNQSQWRREFCTCLVFLKREPDVVT